jgi:predicted dehydrogenase
MAHKRPLTVAWLGCGNLSSVIHFPIIRRMGLFEVVALCDQSSRNLTAATKVFPDARRFTDHREMARRVRCDVLCVVIPPQFLKRVVPEVISIPSRGIYSEKPLGVSLRDAQVILDCVPGYLRTFCGFNWRFKPGLRELIELVTVHGPLTSVEVVYHKHATDREAWRDSSDSLIFTEMCHAMDALLEVGGPIASKSFRGSQITERNFDILLGQGSFESGALWSVNCNFSSGVMATRVTAHTKGLSVSLKGATDLEVAFENMKQHFPIGGKLDRTWAEGFHHEWEAFGNSLRVNKDSSSTFGRALETMSLCQAAFDAVSRVDDGVESDTITVDKTRVIEPNLPHTSLVPKSSPVGQAAGLTPQFRSRPGCVVTGGVAKKVALFSRGGWGDFFFHLDAIRIFHDTFPQYELHLFCSGDKPKMANHILPFINSHFEVPASTLGVRGERFHCLVYLQWLTRVVALVGDPEDYIYDRRLYESFDAGRSRLPLSLRQYYDTGLSLREVIVRSWGLKPDADFVKLEDGGILEAYSQGISAPYIAVCNDVDPSISAAHQTKQVPEPVWRMLLQSLVKLDHKVVEIGMTAASHFAHENYLNLIGRTNALEWIKILKGSSGILAIEGGTAHLAAILRKPAMVLCGPTEARHYGHDLHLYVTSGICSPCHWKTIDWFSNCPEGIDQACMYGFDPDILVDKFVQMLD